MPSVLLELACFAGLDPRPPQLVPEAIRHAEVAGHLGGDPLVELRLGCRIQRALRRGDIFHDLPRIGPRRVRVDSEPLQLLRQVVRHDKLP